VRGGDLVGRLGGDEFLVVLSQIHSDDDPAKIARHALKKLQRPYRTGGLEVSVTPSIGISVFPEDGDGVHELIRNADTAMYYAKEYGRNAFQFFKREHNERAAQALRIETRLRKALDEREFVLYYQAVIDVATEAVVGAEALLRWPQISASPGEFIPVAEKAGFMQRLGAWVLKEACRQRRQWDDAGLPSFPVSVNVSPVQFRQKNWASIVSDALAAAGVQPQSLRVEVTESTVMANVEEAAAVLAALRHAGIQVALDDFGTGYSSLSSLSQLPIDILKIDQSFLRAAGRDRASAAIAEGIIALGHSLGLEIIAEGVETAEALAFLRGRNCSRAQGYYFCKPMPAREFQQWCQARFH
jgi:predicted signal transduction protein with EAL and GGDEF domain